MIHIIFILIKPFSDPSSSMDGGIVILEETTPISIEVSHRRIKAITQNNFVLICSDLQRSTSTHTVIMFSLCFVLQSTENNHTCVFWDSAEDGGSWSARGCDVVDSKPEYTVCSCNHLSSFAVLMALYDIEVETMMIHSKQ